MADSGAVLDALHRIGERATDDLCYWIAQRGAFTRGLYTRKINLFGIFFTPPRTPDENGGLLTCPLIPHLNDLFDCLFNFVNGLCERELVVFSTTIKRTQNGPIQFTTLFGRLFKPGLLRLPLLV